MNKTGFSPVLNKVTPNNTGSKTMTFSEAIKEVIIGKKMHKLEWTNKEYFGFLNGGILSLHKPDGKNYQWVISDADLTGKDYIIL